MDGDTSSRFIPPPPGIVLGILLRPLDLPAWNPAFVELAGASVATVGEPYSLVARGGFRGTFSYTSIESADVRMSWTVPGMQEWCGWTLRAEPGGTLVGHWGRRSGPLAIALRSALHGLADLRLDRLADTATAHPPREVAP